MKTQYHIFITTMVLLLLSCKHDSPRAKNYEKQFYGKWELVSITGGFSQPEVFKDGKIVWEFSSDKSLSIKVKEPISKKSRFPFEKDTMLTFSADSAKILIGKMRYDYQLTDKKLKLLDNLATDGMLLEFEKR